jgi:hypothetical protein
LPRRSVAQQREGGPGPVTELDVVVEFPDEKGAIRFERYLKSGSAPFLHIDCARGFCQIESDMAGYQQT